MIARCVAEQPIKRLGRFQDAVAVGIDCQNVVAVAGGRIAIAANALSAEVEDQRVRGSGMADDAGQIDRGGVAGASRSYRVNWVRAGDMI